MNLPEEYRNGRFIILPIAYEKDLTYGQGTSKGPTEIIKASEHLEYYDEQFGCEPFVEGIQLLPEIKAETPEEMVEKVSAIVKDNQSNFIIGLGGDHSVTIGLVKGQEQLHQDFSVIIFDAHADFRDSWNNSVLNHACVSKQLSKRHDLALLGIRSMDIDEAKQINQSKNVHLLKAHDFSLSKLKEVLPKLKDKVYISIDVDVFDPSFIRNTGTPEPGGLSWKEVTDSLQEIFRQKEIVGADIVEFSPQENYRVEAYSLAKLVYKLFALIHKKDTLH